MAQHEMCKEVEQHLHVLRTEFDATLRKVAELVLRRATVAGSISSTQYVADTQVFEEPASRKDANCTSERNQTSYLPESEEVH